MIVTVTLNAALDRTLTVPNFQQGHRHRASQGLTLDDLSIGTASTADGDITALQVPGMDAALLLPAVSERFSALGATATPTERAGKALISFPGQPLWLYASGDVLWMITQPDEAALDAILEVLP